MLPASAGGGGAGGGGGGKHKLPVAPWAPPSTACAFTNNTIVGSQPIASGLVTFLDQVRPSCMLLVELPIKLSVLGASKARAHYSIEHCCEECLGRPT